MKLSPCLLFLWILGSGFARSQNHPDVLMIAVDDLRPMLGCYGDQRVQTPHIDKLAERGLLFERAYCQYAKCGTSRLSLMTGLRPDSIGVFSNNVKDVQAFRRKNPDLKPIGQWFKENGYETRSFGKIYHDGWDQPANWSSPSRPGRDREMLEIVNPEFEDAPTVIADRYSCPVSQNPDVPDNHLFAGRMTAEVIALLQSERNQPLFLAMGYRRPHLPFIAPKKYFDLYQPDESWLPIDPTPPADVWPLAWFNSDGYIGSARKVGLTMPNPPDRIEAINWNGYELRSYLGVPNHGPMSKQLQIDLLHAYAACVSYIDTQIGKVIAALEESGKIETTTIVLWSDHGWHLGEHSAWGKMTNYEIATRVPLIFAGPDIEKGRTQSFAELVDIYPTLCELANLDPPPHLEGDSLVPILNDKSKTVKTQAVSQYSRYNGKYIGKAIRTDRYRRVTWYDRAGKVIEEELYDHRNDPAETVNLAPKSR